MRVVTFKCPQDIYEAIRAAAYRQGHSNNSKIILAAIEAAPEVQRERKVRKKKG